MFDIKSRVIPVWKGEDVFELEFHISKLELELIKDSPDRLEYEKQYEDFFKGWDCYEVATPNGRLVEVRRFRKIIDTHYNAVLTE